MIEWTIAIDIDPRNDNPCDRVVPVFGAQNDIVTHRQALPHRDVAAAIETVRASSSPQSAVKLAFEFLVLTAARSAEVRLSTRDEMDVAGRVWTVPALRMKAKREHRVPLCRHHPCNGAPSSTPYVSGVGGRLLRLAAGVPPQRSSW